jgi:hypothetical protein
MCQNILKAAQSRDRSLLEIGGNRKSRAKAHNSWPESMAAIF